jgi:threonine dehydratase
MGVALAARARGARVTVMASAAASPLKVEKMRELGAEVVLVVGDYGAAEAAAIRAASDSGRIFVSPYNDPWVMAGAGTVALDLLEERRPGAVGAVLIPAGGGGLLAGAGSALKQTAPGIVVAVQSEASPTCTRRSTGGTWRR